MRAMTEIEWLDGRVTKVPELALGDALGESVQAELDFGFDDVLEGLWVEVRHHEPDEDSDGDPRGRGCALYADCRYSLVEPSEPQARPAARPQTRCTAVSGERARRRASESRARGRVMRGVGSESRAMAITSPRSARTRPRPPP